MCRICLAFINTNACSFVWFGDEFPYRVRRIVEVIADYIQHNRLQLDPSANPEQITYHDSCNLGRKGGVLEEPRLILKSVTKNFREMTPSREEAYCCGGGSGLVANPDVVDLRMLAGKPKIEQIRKSGASLVAAACENCRLQLGDLSSHYGAGFGVIAIADLVVRAMRLPGASKTIRVLDDLRNLGNGKGGKVSFPLKRI